MRADRDLSLMDMVFAQTYASKPFGLKDNPASDAVVRAQRQRLKLAQRFVLDDDAVRLIVNLQLEHTSIAKVDALIKATPIREDWLALARLPHNVMWIEFNSQVEGIAARDAGLKEIDLDKWVERTGYLIFKDGEQTATRWVCHEFYSAKEDDGRILVHPGAIAYVFDPEGDDRSPLRGSHLWKSPTLSLRSGLPTGLVGETPVDHELLVTGMLNIDDDGSVVGRVAVIAEPWYDAHVEIATNAEGLNKLISTKTDEGHHQFARLITMLAVINGLPHEVRLRAPNPGKRTVGMHQLSYLSWSTISIAIPPEDQLITARKLLDKAGREARRLRRHTVRGHWRVVDRKPVTHLCRHMPIMVENGEAMCERCERLVRWIDAHERGDETLGVVEHDYKVTARPS